MSQLQAKRDHRSLLLANDRAMDEERSILAARISAVIKKHANRGEAMGPGQFVAIMRDVDRELDEWYGRRPNDPNARFLRVILISTERARRLAIRRSQQIMERLLPPRVIRALRRLAEDAA